MATATVSREWTLADLLERFGPMPIERIRRDPPPGSATEADVIAIERHEGRLCELVDGVLVEKAMGFNESVLAVWLAYFLQGYLQKNDLGILAGESGMIRLRIGLVRIPDLSFVSWDRFPNRELTSEPIAPVVPNLAIEIWSVSNTKKEMSDKLDEYFAAGVELVWSIDPRDRTVEVFTARDHSVVLQEIDTLDGGAVLPGFSVAVAELFKKQPPRKPKNGSTTKRSNGRKRKK